MHVHLLSLTAEGNLEGLEGGATSKAANGAESWQAWPSSCRGRGESVWPGLQHRLPAQAAHRIPKAWASPYRSSAQKPFSNFPGTEKRYSPEPGFEVPLGGPSLSS